MNSNSPNKRYPVIFLALLFLSGCVYYNTFFMAKKKFNEAEKSQKENAEKQQEQEFGEKSGGSSGGGGRIGQKGGRELPGGRNRNAGRPSGGSSGQMISKANAQERSLYESAIEKASKVLTYHPKSKFADDALWLIGKSYFNMGDYSSADRKFKELVINHPESKFADDAYYYMGLGQIELDAENLAIESFKKIEKEFANSEYIDEIFFNKGRLAIKKKDYTAAIDLFKQFLEKYPNEDSAALAAYTTGQCYEELGDYHNAYNEYRSVGKYNPSRRLEFESSLASASAILNTDSIATGMKILNDLAEDERYFSVSARIRLKIAEGYRLQTEMEKSIAEYETIVEQSPKTPESAEAFYRLGLIYQNELFDVGKAKESFGKVQNEFRQSEYRNLALARSAQIAKFETYRTQLQRADSVRTAKNAPESDSTEIPVPPDSSGIDSLNVAIDSMVVDTTKEIITVSLPDSLETRHLPDTLFAGIDSLNVAVDSMVVDTTREIITVSLSDSLVPTPLPDTLFAGIDDSVRTIIDSLIVRSDSSIVDDSSGVARVDSTEIEIIDEQAIIDSINATIAKHQVRADSLRQAIIEKGVETRFLLAELYAYELNQPDSAINEYLLIVEQYPNSAYTPKSLLATANLKLNSSDSLAAGEYLQRIIDNYPQTPQAAVAAEIIKYPLDLSINAVGLYATAESLIFEGGNPDSAAAIFGYIADNFPDLAPKAAFARARAIDLAIDGADSSAYFAYELVTTTYPQSIYANAARDKMGRSSKAGGKRPSPRERNREKNPELNQPDTAQTIVGGFPPAPPIKTPGEFVYPQSLLDRRLKGEVLFKIKINLFGKIEEHEIIGPSGEFAIDSSATEALKRTEFDTSKLDLAQLDSYFTYVIPFERPDINIFNDPYREEQRDPR
ncbi:MAG: tetratricopeptide repeat protein [candidate division Zixibacteria bacterium]